MVSIKKTNIIISALIIRRIIFVVGLLLIFSASSISKDDNNIKSAIFSYQFAGLLISLISGLGALMNEYMLYKEK